MYLKRELEDKILGLWNSKRFFVIRGPRRSGKTTLMRELSKKKRGTYLTFESPSIREEFLSDPLYFVKSFKSPLFLDEIQYLGEEGSRALKLIYDESKAKLVISGSGAFDVRMSLFRYLVGRAYVFDLLPLSFSEVVKWKSSLYNKYIEGNKIFVNILEGKTSKLNKPSPMLEKLFSKYLILGGYPEVVLKEEKEELESIATTTLEEDIIRYFSLKHSHKLWDFSRKLAALIGNLINYSSFSLSFQTVEEYIAILNRSFVIKMLEAYSTNKLKEVSKIRKVYFYDVGFRNALLGDYNPNKGQIMENAIFRQLIKYGELRYWRSKNKAEVDFILIKNGDLVPIEVKSGEGKITRSLISFIKKYNPKTAVVISSKPWRRVIENTNVFGVPPYFI